MEFPSLLSSIALVQFSVLSFPPFPFPPEIVMAIIIATYKDKLQAEPWLMLHVASHYTRQKTIFALPRHEKKKYGGFGSAALHSAREYKLSFPTQPTVSTPNEQGKPQSCSKRNSQFSSWLEKKNSFVSLAFFHFLSEVEEIKFILSFSFGSVLFKSYGSGDPPLIIIMMIIMIRIMVVLIIIIALFLASENIYMEGEEEGPEQSYIMLNYP